MFSQNRTRQTSDCISVDNKVYFLGENIASVYKDGFGEFGDESL